MSSLHLKKKKKFKKELFQSIIINILCPDTCILNDIQIKLSYIQKLPGRKCNHKIILSSIEKKLISLCAISFLNVVETDMKKDFKK